MDYDLSPCGSKCFIKSALTILTRVAVVWNSLVRAVLVFSSGFPVRCTVLLTFFSCSTRQTQTRHGMFHNSLRQTHAKGEGWGHVMRGGRSDTTLDTSDRTPGMQHWDGSSVRFSNDQADINFVRSQAPSGTRRVTCRVSDRVTQNTRTCVHLSLFCVEVCHVDILVCMAPKTRFVKQTTYTCKQCTSFTDLLL